MSNISNNNIIENIAKMYPYGQFPHQYTQRQKEIDINNLHVCNYYTNDKFDKVSAMNIKEGDKNNTNKNNNINIQSLLPLLTSFSEHKKLSSNDMLTSILPLIMGNKSKDITALLKLFNKNHSTNKTELVKKVDLPPSEYNSIDSYDRA